MDLGEVETRPDGSFCVKTNHGLLAGQPKHKYCLCAAFKVWTSKNGVVLGRAACFTAMSAQMGHVLRAAWANSTQEPTKARERSDTSAPPSRCSLPNTLPRDQGTDGKADWIGPSWSLWQRLRASISGAYEPGFPDSGTSASRDAQLPVMMSSLPTIGDGSSRLVGLSD